MTTYFILYVLLGLSIFIGMCIGGEEEIDHVSKSNPATFLVMAYITIVLYPLVIIYFFIYRYIQRRN